MRPMRAMNLEKHSSSSKTSNSHGFEKHSSSCKTCNSHDSTCSCDFKAARKTTPLNSDCILVNSVVCSKMVQKAAEFIFPGTAFTPVIPVGAVIVSVGVVPNLAGIVHNVTVIRDKVVNIGFIPATITVTALVAGVAATFTLTTSLPFQEHTDCPGACPEDTVTEAPFVIEGIFTQPGVPVLGITGLVTLTGILVKVILRTTITVTRPLIMDSKGDICDVNDRRCEGTLTTPPTFTLPTTPTGP